MPSCVLLALLPEMSGPGGCQTFILSSKPGREVYVQPIVDGKGYHFTVKLGSPPSSAINGSKLSRGSFGCVMSGTPIGYAYIDDEANAKRSGSRLMAIVAEGIRGRVYLPPTPEAETVATSAQPSYRPDTLVCSQLFQCPRQKSWWLLNIATGAKKRQKISSWPE